MEISPTPWERRNHRWRSRVLEPGSPDPNVAAFLQANPYFQPIPALAAQGIIDPTKIDPAAQAYIALGLIPTSPTGELFPSGGGTNNTNELTGKIDFDITPKDRLSGTVGGIRNPQLQPFGTTAARLLCHSSRLCQH